MRLATFAADDADVGAVRAVARGRVLVATGLVLAFYFAVGDTDHEWFQNAVAFVVMPIAVVLALAADSRRPPTIAFIGCACDLIALSAAMREFPELAETLAAGLLLPVLIASFTGGVITGIAAATAGTLVLLVGGTFPDVSLRGGVIPLVAAGMAVSVALVARGGVVRLRLTNRERRSLERANVVLEQAASPIVVTGRDGVVVQMNQAAAKFLPRHAAQCADVLSLEVGGVALDCRSGCALAALCADNGAIEAVHRRVDGAAVPVLASATRVADAGGVADEYVHTLQDITRLKLADEAKTLFLATATHELKTPLTVIRGFLETIANPGIDEDLRNTAIGVMRNRAAELGAIVERLLLASRIESGRLEVALTEVDVVASARDRVRALAQATGRMIALVESDVPSARGDATALDTVLDHLLDNGCKYSPPDSPVAVTVTSDATHVLVAVRDEGVGMSADDIDHCFDRFWQADPTSRRRVGGTGIGLYIVKSLSDAMGAELVIDSEVGQGTTFTLRLRRADVVAPAPTEDAAATPEREPSIVREFMRQIGVPAPGRRP